MPELTPTRGAGLLEGFLARQRAAMANALIPADLRSGCILDIGCGNYPYFLLSTKFVRKIGLDKLVDDDYAPKYNGNGLQVINYDVESCRPLPIEGATCSAVTMLATLEHIEPPILPGLLREVYRVLSPQGVFVMTTPAAWTQEILRLLAQLGLVSRHEIDEQKAAYTQKDLTRLVGCAFSNGNIQVGHFEMLMNIWLLARKPE